MRQRAKTFAAVAIAVILLAVAPLANSLAQKGYFGQPVRWLAQMFVPKADLYDPLFQEPIDVSTSGAVFRYRFHNRYAGRHTFGLLARDQFDLEPKESYTRITCRDKDDVRYREQVGSLSPWWKPSTQESGFSIFVYIVPKDLPLATPVNCDVSVLTGDPTFASRFHIYAFYAQKESEE